MIAAIYLFARRCVAWPVAIIGIVLTMIAEGCILFAAGLVGIDVNDDSENL